MTTEPLVLAVDDEVQILRLVKAELEEHGFHVVTATNGDEALRMIEEQRPDVILLDVMMPDMDGVEIMNHVVREHYGTPVILLTAKDRDTDKVRGLELGADDYVVKPFNPDELAARIRAVLRRQQGPQTKKIVRSGELEIDLERRTVTRNGEPVMLTRTEWLLLQQLASNPEKVMTNTELLSKVWGPEYRDDLQYLRVWVSRLRRKLEEDPSQPEIITTRPGIGYMLSEQDAPASVGSSSD